MTEPIEPIRLIFAYLFVNLSKDLGDETGLSLTPLRKVSEGMKIERCREGEQLDPLKHFIHFTNLKLLAFLFLVSCDST